MQTILLAALYATAVVDVPDAVIEGPIDSVTFDGNPNIVLLTSMGIPIRFQNVGGTELASDGLRRKAIRTPVKELTITEFKSTGSLPGRIQQGFVGGTVIAEGQFTIDGTNRFFDADFLSVEPAENVVIGALTKKAPTQPFSSTNLRINGVDIELLSDSRMPAGPEPFHNQFGFSITPSSMLSAIDLPQPTAAEGYYANNRFYAFAFEYGGTGTLTFNATTDPRISLERAEVRIDAANFRCNFRGHLAYNRALGSIPTVELFWDNGDPMGPADIDFQETTADASYLRWRFTEKVARRPGLPTHFKIVASANGAVLLETTEELEVTRIDPAD